MVYETEQEKYQLPNASFSICLLEQRKSPLKINKSLNNLSDLTKYSKLPASGILL